MPNRLPISKEDMIRYLKQNAGKKTRVDMASELGIAVSTIQSYARIAQVSLQLDEHIERVEAIRKYIRDNHKTMKMAEVAAKFKVNSQTIYSYAKNMGVSFEGRKLKAKIIRMDGFFNEAEYKNWLTGWQ